MLVSHRQVKWKGLCLKLEPLSPGARQESNGSSKSPFAGHLANPLIFAEEKLETQMQSKFVISFLVLFLCVCEKKLQLHGWWRNKGVGCLAVSGICWHGLIRVSARFHCTRKTLPNYLHVSCCRNYSGWQIFLHHLRDDRSTHLALLPSACDYSRKINSDEINKFAKESQKQTATFYVLRTCRQKVSPFS